MGELTNKEALPMPQELSALLNNLCTHLSELWAQEGFRSYHSRGITPRYAKTTAKDSSATLSLSGHPVRGHEGVEVRLPEKPADPQERIQVLIINSYSRPEPHQTRELQDALERIRATVEEIAQVVDADAGMAYRLYGAIGYKTWSPAEFASMRETSTSSAVLDYLFSLSEFLAEKLAEAGFDPDARTSFTEWESIAKAAYSEVEALRARENYRYEVAVFLNGPPVDSLEEVSIARLKIGERPVEVFLRYATDKCLGPLVEYSSHPALQRINTMIRYEIDVPVEAAEDYYLAEYSRASSVAQLVLDGLRLCRPRDDIGILALEMTPRSSLTPGVRSWTNPRRTELARFEPRRFDFSSASTVPLSEAEIEVVREAVNLRLGLGSVDWQFDHAIARFGNSIERYSSADPERLLEYAIALEALYLNDIGGDTRELSYRLRFRAARFLGSSMDERKEIFGIIGDLYNFRSRIAHGTDISRFSDEKNRKLEKVLEFAPEIVARSILELLRGISAHPETKPRDFWQSIELS